MFAPGESSWSDNGISLCSVSQDPHTPLITDLHRHFDVVFVDHTGFLNLAYTMDRSTFSRVRCACKYYPTLGIMKYLYVCLHRRNAPVNILGGGHTRGFRQKTIPDRREFDKLMESGSRVI